MCPRHWPCCKEGFRQVGLPLIVSIYVGLDERVGHPGGIAGGEIFFSVSAEMRYVGVVVYARGNVMRSFLTVQRQVSVSLVHDHVL